MLPPLLLVDSFVHSRQTLRWCRHRSVWVLVVLEKYYYVVSVVLSVVVVVDWNVVERDSRAN
jgi:hypothetical protein